MRGIVILAALAAGCAGDAAADEQCQTSLSVTPSGNPTVGVQVRVAAIILNDYGGVPDIEWRVRYGQMDVPFTGQGTEEISFTPDEAGTYNVDMTPSSAGAACQSQQTQINVVPLEPGNVQVRLRVTPPLGVDVPPTDRVIELQPTPTYALGNFVLRPGTMTSGTVGMPAYMRFVPGGEPDAVVEAYAGAGGAFSARVQLEPHHILVIPENPAFPPQVFADSSLTSSETYTLSAGVAITGSVLRPNGTALAGAKVQLFQNHTSGIAVPSTIGTSAADGTFTLRSFTTDGAGARVVVTPPAGSGLPRLEATSPSFNFANPITVSYGSTLATRNVSGTTVSRSGALANAKVTIVGTIPTTTAGSIAAGAAAVASGTVRIPLTANGSGALPSALVPAADLFAVVEPANAPGDAAVVPFDTSAAVPSTITAPAMIPFSTLARLDGQSPLGGVRFELVPAGALGMAGVGPTVLYANEAGVITGAMASGAIYKTYVSDPSRQGAPSFFPMLDSAKIASLPVVDLGPSLVITGTLSIQGQTNRIEGAAVQVFCNTDDLLLCDGVERERPLGEDASTAQGTFEVAVTRPVPL